MSPLPAEVDAAETIVRAVKSPFHLHKNKKRLTKRAFHPVAGECEFSVIRQLIGDDAVKDRAVDLMKDEKPPAMYMGLAVCRVRKIREAGGGVVDKPKDFFGHAHVVNPHRERPEVPLSSAELERLDDYYVALLDVFVYYVDHHPEAPGWSEEPLAQSA